MVRSYVVLRERVQIDRRPDIDIARVETEALGEHANDGLRRRVDLDLSIDHARIGAELSDPEAIRQHDLVVARRVAGNEEPPKQRSNAHEGEEILRRVNRGESLRLAFAKER